MTGERFYTHDEPGGRDMSKKEESLREVLYQKLGDKWYAFSQIDGEIKYSPCPDNFDPWESQSEIYNVLEGEQLKTHVEIERVDITESSKKQCSVSRKRPVSREKSKDN